MNNALFHDIKAWAVFQPMPIEIKAPGYAFKCTLCDCTEHSIYDTCKVCGNPDGWHVLPIADNRS